MSRDNVPNPAPQGAHDERAPKHIEREVREELERMGGDGMVGAERERRERGERERQPPQNMGPPGGAPGAGASATGGAGGNGESTSHTPGFTFPQPAGASLDLNQASVERFMHGGNSSALQTLLMAPPAHERESITMKFLMAASGGAMLRLH